ncbi:MAG: DUF2085 domain-containing protein [Thermoplasmatota archaeon]
MKKLARRSEIGKGESVKDYLDDRWWVNRKVCHGDPKRSFYLRGRPMPLCARCSGLYYSIIPGMMISLPLYILFDPSYVFMIAAISLTQIPWIVDGITQYYGLGRSNNYLRLYTGILGGTGWGSFLGYWIYLIL